MQYRYFGSGNHASAVIKSDYQRVREARPRWFAAVKIPVGDKGERKLVDPPVTPPSPRERHEFWVRGNYRYRDRPRDTEGQS